MNDSHKPTVMLVDGYSLIFRGFHALPLLTSPSGEYTNAVHGFFSMLLKALSEYRPDCLCVMMDMHAPTFRHTLYEEYKGTRKPMPEELRPQLSLVREILSAMRVRICASRSRRRCTWPARTASSRSCPAAWTTR